MPDINLSPYTAQQGQIEQRRRMAELLSQQGAQPLDTNQTAGGYVVPVSPYAGLAKLLQSYTGAMGQRRASEDQLALGQQYRSDQMGDMTALAKMLASPGSAATPERAPIQDPQEIAQQADGMSQAPPNIPAQPAVAPGQINPDMMGQFKTPEGQQMAMAQLLAQVAPKTLNKVGPDESLVDNNGNVRFRGTPKLEYGTTPHYEVQPDGAVHAIVFSKNGERKDLGVATPQNQFNAPTVDATRTLNQNQNHWSNLSPYQSAQIGNERAGLGLRAQGLNLDRQRTNFDTMTDASGMTGRERSVLAGQAATLNMGRERDANSVMPILDQAEKIIGGAHGSGIGNLIGGAQNFVGLETNKNAVDAQLKVLSGSLVSKMPKMSGPQSDKDVLLYKEMAGQIGDPGLPINVRKAAMQEVRRINEKYATPKANTGGASGTFNGVKFLGFE